MKEYTLDNLDSIVKAFNNKVLPKSDWNHNAHIIIAFWYNWNYPFPQAVNGVRANIKGYNESVGTDNTDDAGYHETLTLLWMTITKNYILEFPNKNFEELTNDFLQTKESKKEIVFDFYSKEVLFSKKARKSWVEGDINPVGLKMSKINNHLDLTDAEFITRFEDCSLPSDLFTHEAHLRLAYLDIKQVGLEEATDLICKQITNYVIKLGALDKFNRTLTIAATRAVYHFIQDRYIIPDFVVNVTGFETLKMDSIAAFKTRSSSPFVFFISKSGVMPFL